ncbi:MAG: hypothetical protein ABR609_11730 [Acidimicrobiia bacterium]
MTADFTGETSYDPPDPRLAADRATQAAHYLGRLLEQIAGVRVLPLAPGPAVTFITPAPASALNEALAGAGAELRAEGTWESTVTAVVGWWHRRNQLVALAQAVEAFLAGLSVSPIEADRFDEVPFDLPRRRLGTIA